MCYVFWGTADIKINTHTPRYTTQREVRSCTLGLNADLRVECGCVGVLVCLRILVYFCAFSFW